MSIKPSVEQQKQFEDSWVATVDAAEALLNLRIPGLIVQGDFQIIAKVNLKFPDRKTYFRNSERLHAREVELMDKYPGVKFDFDIQFQRQP